ncbi:MAG: DMT family transporter [Tissierellales bacterium]|nr:DMT family transporter [Tissierellales bacterium]MBN2827157.1 DMT family transporter [Tissierellales bacterium]
MGINKIFALIAITLASIIWGISFISREVLLSDIHPGALTAVQFFFVTILLVGYNFFVRKKFSINKKDFIGLFFSGIIGITMYGIFVNFGIQKIDSSTASILLAIIPVVCLLVDRFLFHKTLTRLKTTCILGSVVGVYFVIGMDQASMTVNLLGYVYLIIAVLAWVAFCFLADRYYKRYKLAEIFMVQSLGAFASSSVFLFLHPVHLSVLSYVQWIHLINLIVLNACLSYAFYVVAIRELGVTTTNVFNNMVPVVTVLVNLVFYDKPVQVHQLFGMLVIMVSVIMLNFSSRSDNTMLITLKKDENQYKIAK